MAAHDAPRGRSRSRRRAAYRAAVVATLLAGPAVLVPASDASTLAAAPNPEKEYKKLKKRADKLAREYRGELVTLDEAKRAAERANRDAERLTREVERARTGVSQIAANTYMKGTMDPLPILSAEDPAAAVRDAATLEHLARNNGLRVTQLLRLSTAADKSRKDARAKLAAVRKEIESLESQRSRVRKLLAKYAPEPAGRPDGATGTKSPITGNSMTPRMRTVLQEVDSRFGAFPAIGCMRAGDPLDHGSGRACDFMESTGGQMPSAGAQANGDQVAQYVISNASRLGVKYVIWKQRIYDMRSGGGWRAMENRGSVTANHYDHVHISVL